MRPAFSPPAGWRLAERLRPALLSLALNLPLALAGAQRAALGTYVHIFFADHYRLSWFDLREFRWYGGFSAAAHPPLVHQLLALLSWPLSAAAAWFAPVANLPGEYRLRGEEAAYVLLLLAVLAAVPYAVSAFARLFVGPRAARWAGLLAILWPGVGLAGWSFGQLPALAGTVLFLFALAEGGRFVRQGDRPGLLRALALAGAGAAAHHGAMVFALLGWAAVVAQALLVARRDEPTTKARRHKGLAGHITSMRLEEVAAGSSARTLTRGAAWAGLAAITIVMAVWPFWEWRAASQAPTHTDPMALPGLLADPLGALTYWWPAYGAALALLPWAAARARRMRRLRAPAALAAASLALGLAAAAPLPRWLFGEWPPPELCALWAGLGLLPFAGALAARYRRWLRPGRGNWLLALGIWGLLLASALAGALHATLARGQPPRVDLAGPAGFLAEAANDQWRYLTLGFGAQAPRLAVLTAAGAVDGAYPAARGASALRESGQVQLDAALRQAGGAAALRPILESDAGPGGWALRWVFVNDPAYAPLLRETGWTFDRAWRDGVELWRRDRVWPATPWLSGLRPTPAARWWGIAPLAILALAAALGTLDDQRLQRAMRAARTLLLAGSVLALPIGWHRLVYLGGSAEVFLSYRGVLVFASDALLVCLMAAWLAERWAFPEHRREARWGPPLAGAGWLGLTAATGLSLPGSADPWLTTAVFCHVALLGGLYLYLLTEPPRWRAVALLLAAQLALQAGLGLWEFGAQSTLPLEPLRLPFLAGFRPDVAGASVVQTADGARWLRAYGSLWHPNVLGAVLLVCLGGPALLTAFKRAESDKGWTGNTPSWTWRMRLRVAIAAGTYTLGVAVLALSFSRAAWLGAATAAGVLLARLPRAEWRRLWPAAALGAAALAAVVVPHRDLFFTRATADARSPLEQHSVNDRASVARVALDLWARRPWTGVGAGAFVQAMAADPAIRVTREPAHSVPLLVLAETGAPGALSLGALALGIGRAMFRHRRRGAPAIVFGALLAGLLVMSLFDHFLWSSAPGRMLAALALGLWAAAEGEAEAKAI